MRPCAAAVTSSRRTQQDPSSSHTRSLLKTHEHGAESFPAAKRKSCISTDLCGTRANLYHTRARADKLDYRANKLVQHIKGCCRVSEKCRIRNRTKGKRKIDRHAPIGTFECIWLLLACNTYRYKSGVNSKEPNQHEPLSGTTTGLWTTLDVIKWGVMFDFAVKVSVFFHPFIATWIFQALW